MNSEERQAAIDALKDILQSRTEDENSPIGAGPVTDDGKLKIDPNLIYPAPKFPGEASEDLNINDPKGLLSKLKQNNPKNNNKNQDGNIESNMRSNESESNNKGDDSDSDEQKAGNSTPNENQSGEQSNKSSDSDEKTNKSGGQADNANDDYADAWNAIMSKYDLDSISEKDLQDLLQQIQQGKIQNI